MKYLLKLFSIFLSINILIVQLAAATPQDKTLTIHVGYIGETLENVPDGYQKLVRQKMRGLINQNYYEKDILFIIRFSIRNRDHE